MKKNLLTTILIFCCAICFAAIADLSGKWSGVLKTPDGNELPLTYNFKIDGNKLTGTAEAQGAEVAIDSGKVNGKDFTFQITNTNGIVIPHHGTYYGDSVGMNLDFQGIKFHCTLKRDSQ